MFGVHAEHVLGGGAAFRLLLARAGRQDAGSADAVAALAMGKLQYLHDTTADGRSGVARVRLASIPAAFQRLIREGAHRLASVVRTLGWRLVVCVDDTPLPPRAPTAAATNRFAPLAELGSREQPEGAQRQGGRAPQQPEQRPAAAPVIGSQPVAARTRSKVQQRTATSLGVPPQQAAQQAEGAATVSGALEQSPVQQQPEQASPVEEAGVPQPRLFTLRGLPTGATVVCWQTGKYKRWGVATRDGNSHTCEVSLAAHTKLGAWVATTATVAEVARCQAYAWEEVPIKHREWIRAAAIRSARAAGMSLTLTTTDPCPSLFPVRSGQLICKAFPGGDRRPVWGVVSLRPDASPPYIWQVAYVDDDTETMTTREVLRHQQAMPAQVEAALLPRLYQLGATDVPHPDSLTRDLPVAGGVVLIRKVYAGQPYIGVATLRPRAQAPYVYKVSYPADGDTETMHAAEVGEHRVGAVGVVPVALLPALARLCTASPPQVAAQGASGEAAARRAVPLTPEQRCQRAAARRRRRWRAGLLRAAARVPVQGKVKVGCVNVCGLTQQKAGELHGVMRAGGVDVMGVCESWEGRCSLTRLPGYTWVGRPRVGGQGGGGWVLCLACPPLAHPRSHRHPHHRKLVAGAAQWGWPAPLPRPRLPAPLLSR